MFFVAIEKDKFIQMDRVVSFCLLQAQIGDYAGYYWEFVMDNGKRFSTKRFKTQKEAYSWLNDLKSKKDSKFIVLDNFSNLLT